MLSTGQYNSYDKYSLEHLDEIITICKKHTQYVEHISVLDNQAVETIVDMFLFKLKQGSHLQSLNYTADSHNTPYLDITKISKDHNLYLSIATHPTLSEKEKCALATKLVNHNYGCLEYLSEIFQFTDIDFINSCFSSLPTRLSGKYFLSSELDSSKNNNLCLSIVSNAKLNENQKLKYIKHLSKFYDISFLLTDDFLDKTQNLVSFHPILVASYHRYISAKHENGDYIHPTYNIKIWNLIFSSKTDTDKTLKLFLKQRPTEALAILTAYINSKNSFKETQEAYRYLCSEIKNSSLTAGNKTILQKQIKKAANKRILNLTSDSKWEIDEKPQYIRDFLGEDIYGNTPTTCCFWARSTKSQKLFDKKINPTQIKEKTLLLR